MTRKEEHIVIAAAAWILGIAVSMFIIVVLLILDKIGIG